MGSDAVFSLPVGTRGTGMTHKVVGIPGSPKTKGNVGTFLESIMKMASKRGLKTETGNLSKVNIQNCTHCNYCLSKQKPGRHCSIHTDAYAMLIRSHVGVHEYTSGLFLRFHTISREK